MQTRLAISAVVLVLSAGVSVQTATACSKEAVAGAMDRWTTVLAENNPDTIVALLFFKGRETMKRALIAIASVGVLVPAAWVVEANAQQMVQPLPHRKPMPPHRWLLHKLMPNNEEPVAMRVARLPLLLPRLPRLLPT